MHDFLRLTIAEVRRETPDAIAVRLDVPAGLAQELRFKPGQHLAFRAMHDGEEVRRTYSICSGPYEEGLAIAIKRVAGGYFSNWANDTWRAGDTVEALPPAGRFILPDGDGTPRHLAAFAAGAGITPIVSMIQHVLALEPESSFTLVYGNRSRETTIFREVLEDLKDRHMGRFTLLHVLTRNEENVPPLFEGRIAGDKVKALAGAVLPLEEIAHVFLCGPGTLIKETRNALFDLGMPRDRVHYEFFAAGGGAYRKPAQAVAAPSVGLSDGVTAEGCEATVILDGRRYMVSVAPGEAVVDAALRAGVPVPYSCKGGMCSTCRAKVVEGEVDMTVNYSLEPWELAKGFVLTCQSVPRTPALVVDYDQM